MVRSDDSVREAVAIVEEANGRLEFLINNAGIPGATVPPRRQSIEDIRSVYETNVFGPIVTQAFLPLLQAAGSANVVMVSSGRGSLGWVPIRHIHSIASICWATTVRRRLSMP